MTSPETNSPLPNIISEQAETLAKIYEVIDEIYPNPQQMAQRAAEIFKEKIGNEVKHNETLAYSVFYIATVLPNITDPRFHEALKFIAGTLMDFHYISLICELTKLDSDVIQRMPIKEIYYKVLESAAERNALNIKKE